MNPPFTLSSPPRLQSPMVFDSPHSGSDYPDDFFFSCDRHNLRRAEDMYVDELFNHVTTQGAPLLKALFPRSYIDVNRQILSTVTKKTSAFGLFRTLCTPANPLPIYDRPLSPQETHHRIQNYYTPYHKQLGNMIRQTKNDFGYVWHLNCHSMPSHKTSGQKNPYDFILSNQNHKTSDAQTLFMMKAELEKMGYKVGLNIPGYRGAEIVQRYGKPQQNIHSVQLEINRGLYMDENTFTKKFNFSKLQKDLKFFTEKMSQQSLNIALGKGSSKKQPVSPHRKQNHKFK